MEELAKLGAHTFLRIGNCGGLDTEPVANHGHPQSLVLTLPPLSILYLKAEGAEYHKLLALRMKEQRERRSESLAKRRAERSQSQEAERA